MFWLLFASLKDAVFGLALLLAVCVLAKEGAAGLLRRALGALRLMPGVEPLIRGLVRREVHNFLRQLDKDKGRRKKKEDGDSKKTVAIPEKGKIATKVGGARRLCRWIT